MKNNNTHELSLRDLAVQTQIAFMKSFNANALRYPNLHKQAFEKVKENLKEDWIENQNNYERELKRLLRETEQIISPTTSPNRELVQC